MKRFCLLSLSIAVCCLWSATAFAKSVTAPADIPAYYSVANNKSGTALYNAINTITNVGFSSLGYDGAITAYQKSDVYPTDPSHPDYDASRAGKLWDMYGACAFVLGDECGNYKGECDCYNREHSIPKSWWGGGKNNMYSDIFHLVPTDGYVNNRRSAYAFGEVSNVTYTYNECKLGSSVSTITTDKETLLGTSASCSGTVFEPRDEYKGDFARGYLGMIAKYSNTSYSITSGNGGLIFESFSSTQHFGLTKYGIVLLMKWHREDPVSRKEIDRNNGIQATQGNRNPFIDYPYLAEYIWGEKAGETVHMDDLLPSTDPAFVPGVSNGWRGEDIPPTPPTPVTKYGVTWSVNGEAVLVDSIPEGKPIAALPAAPVSCSDESPVFIGWTDAPIAGIAEEAPIVLYTLAAEFPAVTEDVTYYAVFARAIEEESEVVPAEELFDFNNMGLKDKQVISTPFSQNGVTVTFAGGGTPPTYYTGAVRLYAGGTMTVTAGAINQIDFTFGASDKSNVISAEPGTYNKETAQWTGAASEVVFTIGGSNGHRRIASLLVHVNGSGSTTTYTAFLTSCGGGMGIDHQQTAIKNQKVLINNQLYILVGDQLYTITGQRIAR
ncbi:MAG: endonuclease [Paludibacteraceae bacterium]|nr:endonuclease [Paludibacteraceae bacterium]